ncbi:MAG: hypothetical protein LBR39_03830 [Coriobacteriales bacterium]|nr:hypothetical protein [Coriobacteriales bacterium]
MSPSQDEDGTYLLSTASDLQWFADAVNSGNNAIDARLIADIDLSSLPAGEGGNWTPIGQMTFSGQIANPDAGTPLPYLGSFDGDGHTISGLSISGTANGMALFQYVGPGATLCDFTLQGCVSGGYYVAGVAAFSAGTIRGVTSEVTIFATNDVLGGIVGEALDGFVVSDCINSGSITNDSWSKSSGRLGGIVGKAEYSGTISRCGNTGALDGYQYVGGIIGGQFGNVTVSSCYNAGNLTSRSFGKVYLGGIAGKSQAGSITSCYNIGNLYDAHWNTGHIRAIGGIAGCEEGRAGGATAISNCYTTGVIDMYTDNMSGANNIFEVGNISGGNSPTDYNTMHYSNCFYLAGRIAIADEAHPGYILWGDGYKSDPLIWDTTYITAVDAATLGSPEVLAALGEAFVADASGNNNGWPLLAWQVGVEVEDPAYTLGIDTWPADCNVFVSVDARQATAGSVLNLAIDPAVRTERGLEPYAITACDTAGNAVAVSVADDLLSASLVMPAQTTWVRVLFGNVVETGGDGGGSDGGSTGGGSGGEDGSDGGEGGSEGSGSGGSGGGEAATPSLIWPADLDAIWTVSTLSVAGNDTGTNIPAGATVFVTVDKNPNAQSTSLEGLAALSGGAALEIDTEGVEVRNNSGYHGLFSFTMPAADVQLTPIASYAALTVYVQEGSGGELLSARIYSREQMLALAENDLYYTGYASDTEGFIGRAQLGVPLGKLLADADIELLPGSTLRLTSIDGLVTEFSYEQLYGTQRYYYPNLLTGTSSAEKAQNRQPIDALLVIKGNVTTTPGAAISDADCDTLNAYRFVFGQTEADFNEGVPSVAGKSNDDMPKFITAITVVQPAVPTGEPGSGDIDGDGMLTVTDALLAARASVGALTLTPQQLLAADHDTDGILTIADAQLILRRSIGLP